MECSFEKTVTNQDGSFMHSKCINKAKILIVNDPCYGLCYVCAYNKLQTKNKRLKEELSKYRWIPVSEKLPENPPNEFIDILMLNSTNDPYGGYLEGVYNDRPFFRTSDRNVANDIAHWRPVILPDQALEEKNA